MKGAPEPELRPDEPKRYPSTLGGACYMVEAMVATLGMVFIVVGLWRTGLRVMGAALIGAAVARLALADDRAGMLKVRRKSLDAVFLTLLGASLIALSVAVPASSEQ